MPTPEVRVINILKQTDGRDKLFKATAGMAKVVAYNAVDAETAKKATALAKAVGDCRSVCTPHIKFFPIQKYVGKF